MLTTPFPRTMRHIRVSSLATSSRDENETGAPCILVVESHLRERSLVTHLSGFSSFAMYVQLSRAFDKSSVITYASQGFYKRD